MYIMYVLFDGKDWNGRLGHIELTACKQMVESFFGSDMFHRVKSETLVKYINKSEQQFQLSLPGTGTIEPACRVWVS